MYGSQAGGMGPAKTALPFLGRRAVPPESGRKENPLKMRGLLKSDASAETAVAAAAAKKNDNPDPVASESAGIVMFAASAAESETAIAAAAAKNQNQPDKVAASAVSSSVTLTSTTTVCCCQITHATSSKRYLH